MILDQRVTCISGKDMNWVFKGFICVSFLDEVKQKRSPSVLRFKGGF